MSNTSSIFALFAFLVGVMLFGIWSNIHAYAQQSSSSPTLSAASPPTGNSVSKSISPELKAQMCDPTNPNLKVVNTTEAHICGIPKTVKPPLASAATPKTSTVSSSIQEAPTTKPASANITAPKQQQIKAVNNTHVNGISRPADGAAGTTISQVTRPPTNTSSPSSLAIAPQINAVNQLQQAPLIPITRIDGTTGTNGTAGQNHTFQATSPVAASGKLLYLGYHDTAATSSSSTHGNSGSKDKSSQTNKPPTHSSSSSSTNDNSPPKKVKKSSSSSSGTESSTPPHSSIIVTYNNNSPQTTKTTSTAKLTKTHSSSDNTSPKTDKSSTATDSAFIGKKKTTRTSTTNSDLTPHYTTGDSSPPKKVKRSSSSSSGTESSAHHDLTTSTSTGDSGSTRKKHSHLDLTPSVTGDSSPPKKVKRSSSSSRDSRPSVHSNTNNDGIESSASSASSESDLGSAIRDKVDSIIRNSLGEVKHSLFGFSDNGGF